MVDKQQPTKGSSEKSGYIIGMAILIAAVLLAGTIYISAGNVQRAIADVKIAAQTGATVAAATGAGAQAAAAVPDEATIKAKVEKFLNENILSAQGMTATVTKIEPYDAYLSVATVDVKSGTSAVQTVPLYISKDGSSVVIGSQAYKTDEKLPAATTPAANNTAQQAATPAATAKKTDKPVANAFIMAFCPYGLQFLKAYVPVMELLGNKADLQINFVPYSMHGYNELVGNNYIYCVQRDYKPKLTQYLRCAVTAGDYTGCANTTAGIDGSKVAACAAAIDQQYNVTGLYNDKTTWLSGYYPLYNVDKALATSYNVQGSPTFVINGVQSDVYPRTAENVKEAICNSFTTQPAECKTVLSSDSEAAGAGAIGAGATASTGGTAANCGG